MDTALNNLSTLSIYSFNTSNNEFSLLYGNQDIKQKGYALLVINGNYSIGWNTSVSGIVGITALQNTKGDISNCLCLCKSVDWYLDIVSK